MIGNGEIRDEIFSDGLVGRDKSGISKLGP